jgi:toxin ParE1/3/4
VTRHILVVGPERWGDLGAARYRALLSAALRAIASAPDGPITRDRSRLLPGIRSLHVRHVRHHGVRDPAHVIYYRVRRDAAIEIVRVLHERIDPTHNLEAAGPRRRRRPR